MSSGKMAHGGYADPHYFHMNVRSGFDDMKCITILRVNEVGFRPGGGILGGNPIGQEEEYLVEIQI
jgi:hypothetical protein